MDWYHGSDRILEKLRAGSSVTGIMDLARAYSHRPSRLKIEIVEDDGNGERRILIEHDGSRMGYLYKVEVEDPEHDLKPDPACWCSGEQEMLTCRELPVQLIEMVPVNKEKGL